MKSNEGLEFHTKFRLTIHHDDGVNDAPDEYEGSLFTLRSFNTRHTHYKDPEIVLACEECGESANNWRHPEATFTNEGDFLYADWAEIDRADNPEELHPYQGLVGFPLSYFEHGNCRWGLAGTMEGMPDFRWDGVSFAGFLEINLDDDNREWWEEKTPEEQREIARGFLEEFTSWANGEIYGYVLESLDPRKCDQGNVHDNPEEIDSCWGFIGFDYFAEEVSRVTELEGATAENTEIVDKAYGMTDYGDFFQRTEEEVSI